MFANCIAWLKIDVHILLNAWRAGNQDVHTMFDFHTDNSFCTLNQSETRCLLPIGVRLNERSSLVQLSRSKGIFHENELSNEAKCWKADFGRSSDCLQNYTCSLTLKIKTSIFSERQSPYFLYVGNLWPQAMARNCGHLQLEVGIFFNYLAQQGTVSLDIGLHFRILIYICISRLSCILRIFMDFCRLTTIMDNETIMDPEDYHGSLDFSDNEYRRQSWILRTIMNPDNSHGPDESHGSFRPSWILQTIMDPASWTRSYRLSWPCRLPYHGSCRLSWILLTAMTLNAERTTEQTGPQVAS